MSRRILITLLVALVAAPLATHGAGGRTESLYRWRENGQIIYGDSPPAGTSAESLKYDGSRLRIHLKDPGLADGTGSSVVLLTRTECLRCEKVRQYLTDRGVPFQELDVERSEAGGSEYGRLLGGPLPITLIGNKGTGGFDEQRLDALLSEAGY